MRSIHAVPLAAVALALLAGCGSGSNEDDPAAQRENFEDAQLKFVQCLREHGIDVEDPQGGRLELRAGPGAGPGGEGTNNPEKREKAQEECRPILEEAGGPPELSEAEREEFQDQALAFAQCMRRNGINMPDPEFEGGGGIRQRIEGDVDPESARFREAEEKCKEFQPEPPGGDDGRPGFRQQEGP